MSSLDDLRLRINELDRQILELVGKRQETSREVARAKRATGYATRDYNREREVLLAAREAGKQYGVSPQLAESILRLLIRSSLTTQEQASVAAQGAGNGRTALIIGGAGKIGRWFAEFMASQGFAVEIADPAGAPPGFAHLPDWHASPLTQDFIVIATPLGVTDKILREIAMRRPKGVIFDVGSLKSPLRAGLNALKSHGCRVTSLHPTPSCCLAATSSSSRRVRPRPRRRHANCSRPPWWNRWSCPSMSTIASSPTCWDCRMH
jgi:chorismate mutase/prephenate dehydrogenase